MKPKEFDELVRQKFDQNDFEYNPRNWDRLAEELDGRAKKRSVIMWWWMPLAGVAASVALAIGIPGFLRQVDNAPAVAKTEIVKKHQAVAQQPVEEQRVTAYAPIASAAAVQHKKQVKKQKHIISAQDDNNTGDYVAIRFHEPVFNNKKQTGSKFDLLTIGNIPLKEKDIKKQVAVNDAMNTFIEEEQAVKKAPKLSIILSGGMNRGNLNNGYIAGASIRRMVNDKVYVEGDIAFASGTNTQSVPYVVSGGTALPGSAAKDNGAAKTSTPDAKKETSVSAPADIIKEANVTYNVSYAQICPSIGYKLAKRMSLAAGPDFQQMLVDNRPARTTVSRETIQELPVFDIGLTGKTEYSVTKNIKAGMSYRKGINSVITPTGKYIDRDYLQFQVKCAIFNK